jgi:hypothetical protein
MDQKQELTPVGNFGLIMFFLALVGCSLAMSPGWLSDRYNPGWRAEVYYAIMAVIGVVSTMMITPRYVVANLVAGVAGGVGGMFAVSVLLANTTKTSSYAIGGVAFLGAAPAILLHYGLMVLQDRILPGRTGSPIATHSSQLSNTPTPSAGLRQTRM